MGSARDEERERRISMEIVVDAYGPEEQAMGWYYSL
jgi:Calcium binding